MYTNEKDTRLQIETYSDDGYVMLGYYNGSPSIVAGLYAVGCVIFDKSFKRIFQNEGTVASPVWGIKTPIFASAQLTTVGGAAAEVFTISGVKTTDLVFTQMVNNGTNDVTIISSTAGTGQITVTFSGDPDEDTIFNYQIIRQA